MNLHHLNMKKLLLFVLLGIFVNGYHVVAQTREVSSVGEEGKMEAAEVKGHVVLDGILDEEAWQEALMVSDFRQFEPVDGLPATQKTEVRVLYGSNSLYVGAFMYDDDPGAIEKTLGRRDDFNRADWFLVSLDAYFDRRTAYTFGVNAAGVQFDAIQSGSGGGPPRGGGGSNAPRGMDPSWDAIWYANTSVSEAGWAVEIRIPYSMLRFSEAPVQTWGIQFTRRNPRLGEQSEWPHVPRTQRDNLIAQFGELNGIKNVKPRRNIQISPYTVTGIRTLENEDVAGELVSSRTFDIGGDVKIGLGPNITLDATINPDFGQVNADPAELNLTAFETFFEERRPFFIEGINIYEFEVGRGGLLYTRRIGADAPIIGATKLSGRTGSGLSFGILGAATGSSFDSTRAYGVARVSQQVGSYSRMGGILTLFDGSQVDGDQLRSLVTGADWDFRLLDNRYGIEGFFAVTNRNWRAADLATETGLASTLEIRKRQGQWDGFAGVDVFSDNFNPNDAGQLGENNYISLKARVGNEINGGKPFGPFLRAGARLFTTQQFSYDEGLNLGQRIDFGSRWTLNGFQSVGVDFEIESPFGGYDIYETRGLLPWAKSTRIGGEVDFETDERRNWQLEPGIGLTFFEDGGQEYQLSMEGKWNAGDKLSLTGQVTGAWENDVMAWSANETFRRAESQWFIGQDSVEPFELKDTDFVAFEGSEVLDSIFDSVIPFGPDLYYNSIFGQRDTRSVDVTLRSTVTFTPKLSIQLYSQLFAARGRYSNFQLQQSRDQLIDFAGYPKRDEFSFSSLQSNIVLRWEYRPGSSLFVVWSHGRRAEDVLNPLAPWNGAPYDRSFNDQFSNTFDILPENVFLIKLNYTFLY